MASGFSSSNQVMGVRKTTDLLEKLTWGLAITLMVLSIAGTTLMSQGGGNQESSTIQEQIDNAAAPVAPAAPTQQPANNTAPANNSGQ